MRDLSWTTVTISGSNETISTGIGQILPELWPLWQGGHHLPDILVDDSTAPALSGSDELRTYHCPETIVISGGGIIDSVKQIPITRLDVD
jgi:hypothetical protein